MSRIKGDTLSDSHFSPTFAEARNRFMRAAATVGARVTSYEIDGDFQEDLAIDVAVLGEEELPTVVISSGVHGVEGFLGSAIQLAFLEQLRGTNSQPSIRYVLIHSVNPFGFSRLRRFNEDNVDLNRNFLNNTDSYEGAPDGYAGLNGFLNPASPPSRFEPFKLKAMWNIWRSGLQSLKESIAGGQYKYPRGLFFGGHAPCRSTQLVQENCDSWLGSSESIVHIDFHSGLGPFGTYKLLLVEGSDSDCSSWFAETFGVEYVEPLAEAEGTAYKVSGLFGGWMQGHFSPRDYRFVGAEFGTYGVIRVMGAIRAENRAHHYGSEDSAIYQSTKKELLECFCPNDPSWRRRVLESGLGIIDQAAQALSRP
ncbi:MAG: M14 family metallopeptidase [Planctomycetaceae bacterium]